MDDTVTWVCFRCGQAGHLKAECKHPRQQSHPPAPGLPAGPEQGTPLPPPVPPRPPESECQKTRRWVTGWGYARSIRQEMGWSDDGGDRLRALAAEQVSESRMRAAVAGFQGCMEGPPGPVEPARPLPRWTVLPDDPAGLVDWLQDKKKESRFVT